MKKVAIVFATKHGQTEKIVQFLAAHLAGQKVDVQIINVQDAASAPEVGVDAVLYGGPVYRGKFPKRLISWVREHRRWLGERPTGLFSVSLNAADPRPEARTMDRQLLAEFTRKTGAVPTHAASFAGALLYRDYSWPVRWIMRRISARAGGATDTTRNYEYTDWGRVAAFLDRFAEPALTRSAPPAAPAGSRSGEGSVGS